MIFRLEGTRDLMRALDNVSEGAARTARIELRRGALNVQSNARTIITEKRIIDTGRLRNSIAIADDTPEVERTSGQATQDAEAPLALSADSLAAVIGTSVDYAPYHEFGTSRIGARPYLFPAFEQERPEFIARLRTKLREAMRREAR